MDIKIYPQKSVFSNPAITLYSKVFMFVTRCAEDFPEGFCFKEKMDIKIYPQKSIFSYPTITLYCNVFKFVTLLRTRTRSAKDRRAAVFHEGFIMTVATLITYLQLKYQACDGNPFSNHPITMGIAVWSTVFYFLASSGQIPFPAAMSRHCVVLSGNVVIASLSSLFVADSVRPVVYGVAVLVSGTELLRRLCVAILKRRRRSDCAESVSEV